MSSAQPAALYEAPPTPARQETPGSRPVTPDMSDDLGIPSELLESPLHRTWMRRIADGRDLRVIVSADNAATGVGKTTAAVYLAKLWDLHGWGPEKATLDPREYSVKYDEWASGSVAILDEAEQALDRRRSMSKETLAVGHDFMTKRYRQLVGILTLPSKDMMDARIADKLCDFWVLVQKPGEARVFRFDENAFTGKVYYKQVQRLEWPNLDSDSDFRTVEQKKHDYMTGKTESRFVTREEFEEAKKNFWNKATAKTRFEFIRAVYNVATDPETEASITQSQLGQACGMGQSNVSKIVNANSFDAFYKSYAEA